MGTPERDYADERPRGADPATIEKRALAARALDRAASAVFATSRALADSDEAAAGAIVGQLRAEMDVWTEALHAYRNAGGEPAELGRPSLGAPRPAAVTNELLEEWIADLRSMAGSQRIMLKHAESFPPETLLPRIGDLPDRTRGEEVGFRKAYLGKIDTRIALLEWTLAQPLGAVAP